MMTPKEIVDALDRYIIGQKHAKRAVAIALRNRYRRSRLPEDMREEITPKNIIMMGPTGVGKTEIARRLAKLVDAPFIKVEATKFTEVGYVGRDVESIVRDLVETAIRIQKEKAMEAVRDVAGDSVEQILCDLLIPGLKEKSGARKNPLELLLSAGKAEEAPELSEEEKNRRYSDRERILAELRAGRHEEDIVEIEVEEQNRGGEMLIAAGGDLNLGDMFGGILPKRTKRRKLPVKDARRILIQQECEHRIDMDEVTRLAVQSAEQDGIVFIDEIDKIADPGRVSGPDVSREGVQRDILPIVEGSTVNTKYGPVKTDHMLFIAAGAFHTAKVTDLIPELQGRFPIRVRLDDLSEENFKEILTKPENAITKQYAALLSADNVNLIFTDDALKEIAHAAWLANTCTENIGARRLHTVLENLLDDISFNANGTHPMIDVTVDAQYVREHMAGENADEDVRRFIL